MSAGISLKAQKFHSVLLIALSPFWTPYAQPVSLVASHLSCS